MVSLTHSPTTHPAFGRGLCCCYCCPSICFPHTLFLSFFQTPQEPYSLPTDRKTDSSKHPPSLTKNQTQLPHLKTTSSIKPQSWLCVRNSRIQTSMPAYHIYVHCLPTRLPYTNVFCVHQSRRLCEIDQFIRSRRHWGIRELLQVCNIPNEPFPV